MNDEITTTVLLAPTYKGECSILFQEGDSPGFRRIFKRLEGGQIVNTPEIPQTLVFMPKLPDDSPPLEGLEPQRKIGNWTYTVQHGLARLPDGTWIGG